MQKAFMMRNNKKIPDAHKISINTQNQEAQKIYLIVLKRVTFASLSRFLSYPQVTNISVPLAPANGTLTSEQPVDIFHLPSAPKEAAR